MVSAGQVAAKNTFREKVFLNADAIKSYQAKDKKETQNQTKTTTSNKTNKTCLLHTVTNTKEIDIFTAAFDKKPR